MAGKSCLYTRFTYRYEVFGCVDEIELRRWIVRIVQTVLNREVDLFHMFFGRLNGKQVITIIILRPIDKNILSKRTSCCKGSLRFLFLF